MNRSIVTQRQVANTKKGLDLLQSKIRASTININNDSQVVKKANLVGQRLENSAEDLLDEDINSAHIPILQVERLKLLKLNEKQLESKNTDADSYASKLVKYIPTEVIGFYMALSAIIQGTKNDGADIVYYTIAIVMLGVIGTILYLRSVWIVTNPYQIAISCVAFLGWALAIDNNITLPVMAKALILPIITFFLPLLNPPESKMEMGVDGV